MTNENYIPGYLEAIEDIECIFIEDEELGYDPDFEAEQQREAEFWADYAGN